MRLSFKTKRLLALMATTCSLSILAIVTAATTTIGAPTPAPTATPTPTPTPIPNTLLDTITGATTRTFTGSSPRTYMGDGWTNNAIPVESTSVKITGFVLYLTSATTQNYLDVVARIQFWNNCDQEATPVFTNASGPLITVDLGPMNLTTGGFTAIPVTLATPLSLPGGPGTNWGFAQNFQGDTGGGLSDTTNLTSMITGRADGLYSTGQITTGTAPQFGYFRNASARTDFNFDSTDARMLAGVNGQGIGIIIFGFPEGNGIPTPTPTVTVPPTPTSTPTASLPASPTPPVTPTSTVTVTPTTTTTATPLPTPPATPIPGALLDTFTGADTLTYSGGAPRTHMGDGWTNNTVPAGTTSLKITGLTLYMVSATTKAYADIVARIQFWNNYNQTANTVFSNAAGPLIEVDLGPHNLRANTFTVIQVTLATPVILLGGPGTNWGFVQNFLGDTGLGLIEMNSLTSLLTAHSNGQYSTGQITTGTAPQFGFYRNTGGRTDFNFSPFDARGLAGVNAQGVAIVILGTAQDGGTPTPTPPVSPTASPCLATTFAGTGVGPIPDGLSGTPPQYGPPLVISFDVSGLTAPLVGTSVDLTLTHSWVGDLDMVLTSPGGTASLITVSRIGVTSPGSFGDSSNFNGVYSFTDSAPGTNIWGVAVVPACNALCDVAPGDYLATAGGAPGQTNPPPVTSLNLTFAGLTTAQINGTWTLTIRDAAVSDTGSVTAANLSLAEACGAPTPTPPPNPTPTVTATIGVTPTATPTVTPAETSTPAPPPTPLPGTLLDTYTRPDFPYLYSNGTPRTYMGDGWTNNALPAGTTYVKITALRLYMACLTSQSYTDVVARIQFWNTYDPGGRPVFRNPAGPLIAVDLGPISTSANSVRTINVTLASPVILTGGSGTNWGFAQNFQGNTGAGLADTNNLTSLITTHSDVYNFGTYVTGQITTGPAPRYGFYRNASERTDFNFDSDDVRSVSPQYAAQAVSITVFGTAQTGPTPTPTPPGPPTPTPPPPPATPTPTVAVSATPPPSATPSATATATPGGEGTTSALNLSTRMRVQVGDRVGIGGFIITGSANKHVVVRAIGPSLTQFGLTGVLADPILELHGPNGFTSRVNDNWRDAQSPPSVLTPTNDLESAIEASLPPGAYTAVVKGKNNTSGLALVEIYDLSPSIGKLGNISTRAFVDNGDNIVIAGMVLGNGTGPDRVVVRGIAPSLAPVIFTESAILANPTLELRDENGTLLEANDNWHDNADQAAEIIAGGLAPSHEMEAAIAASLPPGFYTVLLAGRNGGTGIGLVEIYDRGP